MIVPVAERLYRRLCRLLPASLWTEAEADLLAVFREQYARVRRRSIVVRGKFWLGVAVDTVVTAAAERASRHELGSPAVSRRSFMWLDQAARDVRHALRLLRRRPGYTLLAITTLALGVGATTAMVTVADAVLVRPLPYVAPGALVNITGLGSRVFGRPRNLSLPDFLDLSRDNRTLQDLGAFGSSIGYVTVAEPDGPERVRGNLVSSGFFSTLGTQPLYGRLTRPSDDLAAANVAVISNGWWRQRFGGDPSIIGRTLRLGGTDVMVIGVLRDDFRYPQSDALGDPDIYGPLPIGTPGPRSTRTLRAIGRLMSGHTVEDAQTDLSHIAEELKRQFPTEDANVGVTVTPLRTALVGNVAPALWLGLAFAVAVLAIGTLNIATLSLAKNLGRRMELSVRTALGASASRLITQMLTESLVLSLLGCAAGWAVGWLALRQLIVLAHDSLPRAADVHLDTRALIWSMTISIAAVLATGLVPALRGARAGIETSLRQAGRTGGAVLSPRGRRLLIGAEALLSTSLLIGAVLIGRGFWHLVHIDPGFSTENTVTAQIGLPTGRYPAGTWAPFFDELQTRTARRPGIQGIAVTNILPLSGNHSCDALQIERHPVPAGREPCAETRFVSASYFDVMRIRVVDGRVFNDADRTGATSVVVINQAMAKRFWPGERVLGQRLTLVAYGATEAPREIVGVVGDTTHLALSESAVPEVYVPQDQPPGYPLMAVVVRSDQPVRATAATLRAELAALDPRIPLYNVGTLDQLLATSVSVPRLQTVLTTVCAGLACGLSLIGIYGVLAETVVQRLRELGIRMCLGASRRHIAVLVLGQLMAPLTVGAGAGLAVAWLFVHWSGANFYGLSTTDAATFIGVPIALVLAALVITGVPLARALGVSMAVLHDR